METGGGRRNPLGVTGLPAGWVPSAGENSEGGCGAVHPKPFAFLAPCASEQAVQAALPRSHGVPVLVVQAKVRELEEKCRTQSEQFNLLSRELERFRQQAGKIDLLSSNSLAPSDLSGSPGKSLSQLMNGIATSIGKGKDQLSLVSVLPSRKSVVDREFAAHVEERILSCFCWVTCLNFRVSLKPSLSLFQFYLGTAVSKILSDRC